MQTILAILRAAHCRSTHHFFAIDALREVLTPSGLRLAEMLLAHFAEYLQGAKDPDTVFKDFENHVVHVSDGYWGGAAKTAEKWLAQTYLQLQRSEWKEAAYSIGVMSHYFTDPWMPLHTGQTPRETTYHRPLEWSVCCAYQEILDRCIADPSLESFQLPTSDRWLTDSIHAGATLSHRYYESLMNDYDMRESGKVPAMALGNRAKEELAQIFTWVLTAWGAAIDKIAEDCKIAIPKFSLTLPTLMATVQIPTKKIVSAMKNAEERREIEKVLEEYNHTGQVTRNVSDEQRMVAKTRQLKPTLAPPPNEIDRAKSLPQVQKALRPTRRSAPKPKTTVSPPVPVATPTPIAYQALPEVKDSRPAKTQKPPEPYANDELKDSPTEPVRSNTMSRPEPSDLDANIQRATRPDRASENRVDKPKLSQAARDRVTTSSPIVDAPAIGPKTAERLKAIGIHTIGDLLQSHAADVAGTLSTSWGTERTVALWIVQARLACEIEKITAAGAGLLALAGIESAAEMLRAGESETYEAILAAAETAEGNRLLRDNAPPSLDRVAKWFASANQAQTSRVGCTKE